MFESAFGCCETSKAPLVDSIQISETKENRKSTEERHETCITLSNVEESETITASSLGGEGKFLRT